MDGPVESSKQLFVRPLAYEVTSEQVQDHFSRAAPVVDVRLMEGYAFVTFENEEDAKQAQEMAMKVQETAVIQELMQKEQAFSMIINDLNRIIMKPVQELYDRGE